jgi:hypothetical protein
MEKHPGIPNTHFDPAADAGGPTVYIGAQIPARLYDLVQQEASAKMLPRAQIVRWALAARYRAPGAAEEESPA